MDNIRPQLGGPSVNNLDSIKESPEQPRKKKHISPAIIAAIATLVIVGGGVAYCFIASWDTHEKQEITTVNDEPEFVNQSAKILGEYGQMTMTGTFGAVPTTLTLDFNSATGTRHYNSTPNDIYTVKIEDVQTDSDGNYVLTITDLLDGRIPIGTYKGTFDGSSYKGTYNSKHGKTRQFYFEQ